MADEELHETDSNNQKDWQSETSSSTVADETASKDTEQNAEPADAAYDEPPGGEHQAR